MSDLNSVVLEGRLTRPPEVRYTPNGTAVASFSIAVNKTFMQNGEKKEDVSYVDIVAWGKQGESCGQYLEKAQQVIVEGSLEMRSWDDKATGQKRNKLEVVAKPFGVHFRSKKNVDGQGAPAPEGPVDDDPIPF